MSLLPPGRERARQGQGELRGTQEDSFLPPLVPTVPASWSSRHLRALLLLGTPTPSTSNSDSSPLCGHLGGMVTGLETEGRSAGDFRGGIWFATHWEQVLSTSVVGQAPAHPNLPEPCWLLCDLLNSLPLQEPQCSHL